MSSANVRAAPWKPDATKDAWAAHSGDKCNVGTLGTRHLGTHHLVIYPQSRRESSYHHQYHHQSPRQSLNIPNIQPRVRACFVAALCPKNFWWNRSISVRNPDMLRCRHFKWVKAKATCSLAQTDSLVHTLMIYQGTKNWRLQAHLVIRGTIKIIKKGGNNDEHPQLRASLDMFRLLWSILLRFNGGAWIPDNVRALMVARNVAQPPFFALRSAALGILLTFGF